MVIRSKESFLKAIGENVRKYRKLKGISQQELALEADIPKNQVGRIERGEINSTVFTLLKISESLQISVSELFR